MYRALVILLGAALVGAASASKCQRITAPICQDVGYNATAMPNKMGDENQEQAALQMDQYQELLNDKCSPFLRLFVCSVFVPFCSEEAADTVPPCRGFCEEVHRDCYTVLLEADIGWHKEFNCSLYPESAKNVLCMQPQTPFQYKLRIPDLGLIPTERKMEHCPYGMIMSGEKCVKMCYANAEENHQFSFLDRWTAGWSIVNWFITTFALLTFIMQPKRFRWPARPTLYLTICGFISSIVFLTKMGLGSFTCSGDAELENPTANLTCIAAALLFIFCEVAFVLWWCAFCLVWFLSAAKEWSTEAIEKISSRIHASIWTMTSITILYTLFSNDIVGNHKVGLCTVKSNVLVVFQLVFVVFGSILAVLTTVALKNVRRAMVYLYAGRSPLKLERLICRLIVTNIGIGVPLTVCLLCNFFDTEMSVYAKVALRMLSTIFAAFWVVSSKTFKNWNKTLFPTFEDKEVREMPIAKV